MKITWYRFSDALRSRWNLLRKELPARRKWGSGWRDYVRPGRTYTRTYTRVWESDPIQQPGILFIRPDPGWEWTCPNCKEYSLITEAMMPGIIADWEKTAKQMTELAAAKGVTYKIPERPTIERALCTNCRFRPGPPE